MTVRVCHTVPMRVKGARISLMALVGVLLSGVSTAALAAPSPTPNPSAGPVIPPAVKGSSICTITDKNALQLSGMAISNNVIYAVNDGSNSTSRQKVFKLNPSTCAVVGSPIGYPATPRDPEDLAVDAQGTMWIADIGDNTAIRTTVAVWKLANDKISGPYRLSYPDGKKYDAEAMVIGNDGLPIIITKLEGLMFTPTGPLVENSTNGVAMKQLGKVTLPKTNTDNPFSAPGRSTVTGATMSADRSKVVLRTYADAFEWAVPDGDIAKAITSGKQPKITPLPMEPWGEAIAYSPDGKFWTISDMGQFENTTKQKPELLSYAPNNEDPNPPSPAAQVQQPTSGSDKAWWSELISSTTRLYLLIGSIGVFGLLLVLMGIIGIKRSRNRRREAEDDDEPRGRRDDGYEDEYYGDQRGYGAYQDPAYGHQNQGYAPPPPGGGNVYGSQQGGGGQQGGNVYGGQQPQYGYEDPYYQPPPPQQYGQQPGYGHQEYPDQGYGQNYR